LVGSGRCATVARCVRVTEELADDVLVRLLVIDGAQLDAVETLRHDLAPLWTASLRRRA
jgi:hypothetical protein